MEQVRGCRPLLGLKKTNWGEFGGHGAGRWELAPHAFPASQKDKCGGHGPGDFGIMEQGGGRWGLIQSLGRVWGNNWEEFGCLGAGNFRIMGQRGSRWVPTLFPPSQKAKLGGIWGSWSREVAAGSPRTGTTQVRPFPTPGTSPSHGNVGSFPPDLFPVMCFPIYLSPQIEDPPFPHPPIFPHAPLFPHPPHSHVHPFPPQF